MLKVLLFVSIALVANSAIITAPGTCETMGATNPMVNVCASYVNYPFYVPNGKLASDLQTAAMGPLNDASLAAMPANCLEALVDFVCSGVYQKCQPEIGDLTDTSKYNFEIYRPSSFPVPIQRPCKATCSNVRTQCGPTLYAVLKTLPDCEEKRDYANGAASSLPVPLKYDPAADSLFCYAPLTASVAQRDEAYMSSGLCKGIITSSYTVPGSSLASVFAGLQKPMVTQSIINGKLKDLPGQLPPWVESGCYDALVAFNCAKNFLPAQTVTVAQMFNYSGIVPPASVTPLLSRSLTIPGTRVMSICTDYRDKCTPFFTRVPDPSALIPNCDATLSTGVKIFSDEAQTFTSFNLALGSQSITLKVPARPAAVGVAPAPFETFCPSPFNLPDNGNPEKLIYGTGCTNPCLSLLYNDKEWEFTHQRARVISALGLVFGVAMLLLVFAEYYVLKTTLPFWNHRMFMIILVIYGCLICVASAISVAVNNADYEEVFCKHNYQPISMKNTEVDLCTAQAGVLLYTFTATEVCFLMFSISALCQLYFPKEKRSLQFCLAQIAAIFLFPLVPTLIGVGTKSLGFVGLAPYCFVLTYPAEPRGWDFRILGSFTIIIVGTTFFVVCAIVYKAYGMVDKYKIDNDRPTLRQQGETSNTDDANAVVADVDGPTFEDPSVGICCEGGKISRETMYQVLGPSVGFLIFMLLIFLAYIILRVIIIDNTYDEYRAGALQWSKCILGESSKRNPAPKEVCGNHPEDRPIKGGLLWTSICLYGNSMIITGFYIVLIVIKNIFPRLARQDPCARVVICKEGFDVVRTSETVADDEGAASAPKEEIDDEIEMVAAMVIEPDAVEV